MPLLTLYAFKARRGVTVSTSLHFTSLHFTSDPHSALNWHQAATVALRWGYGDIGDHQGSANEDDHNNFLGFDAVQFGTGGPKLWSIAVPPSSSVRKSELATISQLSITHLRITISDLAQCNVKFGRICNVQASFYTNRIIYMLGYP